VDWWQVLLTALIAAVVVLAVLAIAAFVVVRRASTETRRIAKRMAKLPWRGRLRVAGALVRDERVPMLLRLGVPALLLYLAMPVDLIPDFLPVIGQLDDLVIVGIGLALLLRFMPRGPLLEAIEEAEADAAARRALPSGRS
jgi:uncharacterized membrane protein YkvA (DUF1232 family)